MEFKVLIQRISSLRVYLGIISILCLAFFIRAHNVILYTTWWADDGGAHLMFVETLMEEKRLPTMAENYLAWHEPGYYAIMALWRYIGTFVLSGDVPLLNWQESLQAFLGICLVWLVYVLTRSLTKNWYVSLGAAFLSAILFPLVKLSAYINNELPVQIGILGLIYLFVRWNIHDDQKTKKVVWWSVLLGFLLWIKLTAILVLFAAGTLWGIKSLVQKKLCPLKYIVLSIVFVALVHAPWLLYKQYQFGHAFSINIYEQEKKQSLVQSKAWEYMFELNKSVILSNPYWETKPHSFVSFLFADTFSDFYNLYAHTDAHFASAQSVQTTSARYTSSELFTSNLWMNRVGVVISGIWIVGILGVVYTLILGIWRKTCDWQTLFLLILISGGIAALVYNNLRHPYLERGVLKAAFIVYMYPLIAILSYQWWWHVLQRKWIWGLLVFVPLLVYLIVGWQVLFVQW